MDVSEDLAWVQRQLSFPRDPTTILAKLRNRESADKSEANRLATITEEICKNMLAMQLQPALMDNYRRFVVITDTIDEKHKVYPADTTMAEPILVS
jgi:SPX domain protein involved in polyphosphate accumulation